MKIPKILRKEYRGPVITAAILSLFVWNAVGFGWFGLPSLGFVTAGGAERIAIAKMDKVAVPLAAQLCAVRFNEQPAAEIAARTRKLREATYSYARGEQLDSEWVRLGDNQNTDQRIVDACAELIVAGHPPKSAELSK